MFARVVWVCVVVVVAWCGVVAASTVVRPPPIDANVTSCVAVRPIFESQNLSAPIPDAPVNGAGLRVCTARGVGCCSSRMEEELRAVVRRDFHALLHHNSRSLEGLLASTAAFVSEHVTSVARQSQNRTLALLAQLYGAAASAAHEPVAALFADVLRALDAGPPTSMASGDASSASVYTLGAAADVSIEDSVHTFFAELFPLVFQHGGGDGVGGADGSSAQRPLSEEYVACLRATAREVQPFGDVPRQLAHTASRTLEATRVLLQALWLGVEVLNSTDQLPLAGDCHAALLRMTFCARCAGLPRAVKPCVGYCLNVLRGCLTQHAGELDLPWNGFVEATERLAEAVRVRRPQRLLRSLLARVTEALMRAAEDAPAVHRKVKRACGPPRFAEGPSLPAPPPLSDANTIAASAEDLDDLAPPPPATPALLLPLHGHHPPPPSPLHAGATAVEAEAAAAVAAQAEAAAAAVAAEESDGGGGGAAGVENDALAGRLRLLLASLGRSRGFYANLAESLCSDESFAETRDTADCWNGQRLGEYSKVVVSSSSSAQKYNPELAWTQRAPDARIAQLSDKLRHIRQVVLSQLTLAPESDSYLRGGGGGIDGSGSGGGEHWREEDTEEEEWVDQGSGSGVPPQDKPRTTTGGVEAQRPSGGSGGASQPPSRDDHHPPTAAAAATTTTTTTTAAAVAIAVATAATRARLASG